MTKTNPKPGEMDQWVRGFLCNAGELSSIPGAHVRMERENGLLKADL